MKSKTIQFVILSLLLIGTVVAASSSVAAGICGNASALYPKSHACVLAVRSIAFQTSARTLARIH